MSEALDRLLAVAARLREPGKGCPWDLEQTPRSAAPYVVEEAYEALEAIENDDPAALREELGDLLFQVVFQARLAEEAGQFDMESLVRAVADKMIERHPHVFGEERLASSAEVLGVWEARKAEKRAAKAETGQRASALDGVSVTIPALARAVKLQKRAARVGFDWRNARGVLDKVQEELAELEAEIPAGFNVGDAVTEDARAAMEEELGDALFVMANVARHLDLDPETALRNANRKFERRFRYIEAALAARGLEPSAALLAEMERLWQAAKAEEPGKAEKNGGGDLIPTAS